uniref:L1 transposable element RRM domain-containing protein n=1 Tax=Amphiprion percula TaxID=161767 RepID=A0A3P8S1B4_AMPPE
MGGTGQIQLCEGRMNQVMYRATLENSLLPSAGKLFPVSNDWIFQQDNVPSMPSPAQSPDLNPIENLWKIIKHKMENHMSKNKEQRETTPASQNTKAAANNAPLTPADMEKLLRSMEDRIIEKLSAQLFADRAIIERHDQTIQHMEVSLNDMETRLTTLESTCLALAKENDILKQKTEDLENRSRRNNIRIIGLPEKAEGQQPSSFTETLLKELFSAESFHTPLTVDRAHRITTSRKKQDETPRPFIVRIHRHQTKERIMKLAREAGSLFFRGSKIHIFHDYSSEVSRRRAAYFTVKSQLRNVGFQYRMLFPATLQIFDKQGDKRSFSSPEEASSFLRDRLTASPIRPASSVSVGMKTTGIAVSKLVNELN